jgi:DNA helicase-2/ATP-dependent DNA helicase PcrA
MPDGIFAGLNDEQAQAVACVSGPVVILAGAGSGKTTTVTRRIAHQVAGGTHRPERILAVTFTDKAAREMGSRLAALGFPGVRVKTFHAEALAQYRTLSGRSDEILPSKTPILLPLTQRLPMPHRFVSVRDIAAEIEWARNRRIGPEAYREAIGERIPPVPPDLMAGLYGSYERRKRERGLMDFEDLLDRTLDLLEGSDGAAASIRDRYEAFSVDEYQDVNLLQQGLLDAWVGRRRDLCVVGDDYQSIFGFTGATPRYLVEFATRYPDCRVVNLSANYRSTPEVLAVANRLAPRLGNPPRRLVAATATEGPAPTLRSFAAGADELAWIAAEARRLHDGGTPWEEMAVLYRINGRSEPLEQQLARDRIPYQVAGAAFLRRPAARAVLSALRRATGPEAPLKAPDKNPEAPLKAPDKNPEAPLKAPDKNDVGEAVQAVVERMGYRPDAEASGDEATRQADLGRLLDLANEYREAPLKAPGTSSDGGIAGFVADLVRRFAPEEDGRGIQILTYHRSKGKEFDAVFLPRLEERELPFALANSPEEQAEERRLFYVGITRARRHLFLSWAATRDDGPRRRLAPSPFLDEIKPPGAAAPRPPAPARASGAGSGSPLLVALKEWRRDEARERGLPAYVIFHDRTLADIADRRPVTVPELRSVSGVGPAKVANYGEAVLAIVKDHRDGA